MVEVCGAVPVAAIVPLFPSIVHIPALPYRRTTILTCQLYEYEQPKAVDPFREYSSSGRLGV